MKVKKLFYLFISSFIAITCAKDKVEKPCVKCQSISEAKEFFGFKVGSWWVYEEESSGLRDSCYVTNSSFESNGYDFDVEIYSSYRGYYYRHWSQYIESLNGCSTVNPVEKICLYVKKAKYKPGDFVGEGFIFFVKYAIGDSKGVPNIFYENNEIIIKDIISNYTFNENTYNKVVKINELNTAYEGIQSTNHYFSKNVGLVRMELIDSNRVWNLINYHIEP